MKLIKKFFSKNKKKTNLLIIIGSLDIGGTERHLAEILPKFIDFNIYPSVYTLSHKGKFSKLLEEKGIPVRTVFGSSFFYLFPKFIRKFFILIATFINLWIIINFKRPSIIHFFLPTAYILGTICCLLSLKVPKVMSRRSLNNYQSKYILFKNIELILQKNIDVILANSFAVKNNLIKEGFPKQKIKVIHNGIDAHKWNIKNQKELIRKKMKLNNDCLVFVVVANLIPYKGHHDLFEALSLAKNDIKKDWKLFCIGKDNGIKKNLIRFAKKLSLEKNIEFLGEVKKVEKILPVADIGLLTSHQEGFSNSIMECMASSIPMIVTDVGGNNEIIENGINGIIVPAHNPKLLSSAIISMAKNPNRSKMGILAKETTTKHFSNTKCVNAYIDVYDNLIKKF